MVTSSTIAHPSLWSEQRSVLPAPTPCWSWDVEQEKCGHLLLSRTLSTLALSPTSLLQPPPNPHPQRSFLPITHAPAAGLDRSVIFVSAVAKCLSGKDPCQWDRGSWDSKGWLSGNGVGLWDAQRSGGGGG